MAEVGKRWSGILLSLYMYIMTKLSAHRQKVMWLYRNYYNITMSLIPWITTRGDLMSYPMAPHTMMTGVTPVCLITTLAGLVLSPRHRHTRSTRWSSIVLLLNMVRHHLWSVHASLHHAKSRSLCAGVNGSLCIGWWTHSLANASRQVLGMTQSVVESPIPVVRMAGADVMGFWNVWHTVQRFSLGVVCLGSNLGPLWHLYAPYAG